MERYTLLAAQRERAMKYWVLFLLCWLAPTMWSQTQQQTAHQVVVSAQMQGGVLVYRVNGRRVEDIPKKLAWNFIAEVSERGAFASQRSNSVSFVFGISLGKRSCLSA
jgi:hypothetical protein